MIMMHGYTNLKIYYVWSSNKMRMDGHVTKLNMPGLDVMVFKIWAGYSRFYVSMYV
jgi:hypothetical protein